MEHDLTTENLLNSGLNIKDAIAEALQKLKGGNLKPRPIFVTSKGDIIDLRTPTPQHSTPELNNDTTPTKVKDYKNAIWFTTGIKLATGEAYKLYSKYKDDKGHFTKICLELGFKKTDRPYFSATIQNNDGDKNTFANLDKVRKLHQHLTENNLPFGAEFSEKYNQIEPE